MEGKPFTNADLLRWFEKFEASQPEEFRPALRVIATAKVPGVMMNIARKKLIEDVAKELVKQEG